MGWHGMPCKRSPACCPYLYEPHTAASQARTGVRRCSTVLPASGAQRCATARMLSQPSMRTHTHTRTSLSTRLPCCPDGPCPRLALMEAISCSSASLLAPSCSRCALAASMTGLKKQEDLVMLPPAGKDE